MAGHGDPAITAEGFKLLCDELTNELRFHEPTAGEVTATTGPTSENRRISPMQWTGSSSSVLFWPIYRLTGKTRSTKNSSPKGFAEPPLRLTSGANRGA